MREYRRTENRERTSSIASVIASSTVCTRGSTLSPSNSSREELYVCAHKGARVGVCARVRACVCVFISMGSRNNRQTYWLLTLCAYVCVLFKRINERERRGEGG